MGQCFQEGNNSPKPFPLECKARARCTDAQAADDALRMLSGAGSHRSQVLRGAASGARCRGSAWPGEGCDDLFEVVDLGLLGFWGHDLVEERLFTDLCRILSFLECLCVFIGKSVKPDSAS